MMSKPTSNNTVSSANWPQIAGIARFFLALFLYNALIFGATCLSVLCAATAAEYGDALIGDWKLAQFLSAYQLEFMKRGLVATGFATLGIQVNYQSIAVFSTLVVNLFFLVFYGYLQKLFKVAPAYFFPFILLFIFAPGTAMQMGADFARFDQINMLITLLALMTMLPLEHGRGLPGLLKILFVTLVLVVGLLIHEAFLFINAPLLLALCYQRVRAGVIPRYALWLHGVGILATMVMIVRFGFASADNIRTMAAAIYKIAPDYDSALSLRVWDRKLVQSLAYTISLYFKFFYLKQLLVLSLPVIVYSALMYRMCTATTLGRDYWLVLLSPAAIAPMYIIGCDFPRWTGLIVFLLFMVFVVMLHDRKVQLPIKKYLSPVYLVPVLLVCLLLGPVGVTDAFPDRWALLHQGKCLLSLVAG